MDVGVGRVGVTIVSVCPIVTSAQVQLVLTFNRFVQAQKVLSLNLLKRK